MTPRLLTGRRLTLVGGLAAITLLVGACSSASHSSSSPAGSSSSGTSGASKGSIVIGVVASLTGSDASFGAPFAKGAELAAKDLSAGVNGKHVVVDVEDDQSTPSGGIIAARKLVDVDHAKVIVFGTSSTVFFPAESAIAGDNVLIVNGGSSSPSVANTKGTIISTLALDNHVAAGLTQWAIQRGYKKAATLFGNDPYGIEVNKGISSAFAAEGGTIVKQEIVQDGQPDYSAEMQQIASSKPQAIFSATFSSDAELQYRQLISLGVTAPWFVLYPTAIGLNSFSPAQGKLFGLEIGAAQDAAWSAKFKAFNGSAATTPWPALGYDSTMLAARGVAAAQSATAAAARTAVVAAAKSYSGPSGTFTFGSDFTRTNAPYQRLELVGGNFVSAS
jgi:branched-chain amino acid transport system substrate-binding protein